MEKYNELIRHNWWLQVIAKNIHNRYDQCANAKKIIVGKGLEIFQTYDHQDILTPENRNLNHRTFEVINERLS